MPCWTAARRCRWPTKPRSTPGSTCPSFPWNCARARASCDGGPRRHAADAARGRGHPRRPAHAHGVQRRPGQRRGHGARGPRAGLSVHGDHRSLPHLPCLARADDRADRRTGRRDRRRPRTGARHHDPPRDRMRHPGGWQPGRARRRPRASRHRPGVHARELRPLADAHPAALRAGDAASAGQRHHPSRRTARLAASPATRWHSSACSRRRSRTGTAVEIDGAPGHLDLDSPLAEIAATMGVPMLVDSDCHMADRLGRQMRFGVGLARRAGITKDQVLNTRDVSAVREFVAAKRAGRRWQG